MIKTVVLLLLSNIFMIFAWYGHLNNLRDRPVFLVILISWGIAFFEYCLQVPANRIGYEFFTLSQLKVIQEVMTMIVFAAFSVWYMGKPITMNFLWAGICLVGAAYFIFKDAMPVG